MPAHTEKHDEKPANKSQSQSQRQGDLDHDLQEQNGRKQEPALKPAPIEAPAREVNPLVEEHRKAAKELYAEREKDNSEPERRALYDQPGLDPANAPDPDTLLRKGTRLDLEDLTGNPGHRGVNPHAPAVSRSEIRGAPVPKAPEVNDAYEGVTGSINEPPGSQVIPEGLPDGGGEYGPGVTPPPVEAEAPTIDSLDPDTVETGAADTTLHVHGTGFTEDSVIHFAGHDEPTTFVSDTEVTTGLTPSLWAEPDTVQCTVKNGDKESNEVDFEFTAPAGQTRSGAKDRKRDDDRKSR